MELSDELYLRCLEQAAVELVPEKPVADIEDADVVLTLVI